RRLVGRRSIGAQLLAIRGDVAGGGIAVWQVAAAEIGAVDRAGGRIDDLLLEARAGIEHGGVYAERLFGVHDASADLGWEHGDDGVRVPGGGSTEGGGGIGCV